MEKNSKKGGFNTPPMLFNPISLFSTPLNHFRVCKTGRKNSSEFILSVCDETGTE